MAILTQLSPNSWLMKTNGDISGILVKTKEYTFYTNNNIERLSTLEDISSKFGKITYQEIKNESLDNLDGYPIRHKEVEVVSTTPAIYKKKTSQDSSIEFYAGYWSIKNTNGWSLYFCPKVSTLSESEHSGPFRSRLECINNNNILNTRDKLHDSR